MLGFNSMSKNAIFPNAAKRNKSKKNAILATNMGGQIKYMSELMSNQKNKLKNKSVKYIQTIKVFRQGGPEQIGGFLFF